MDFEKGIKYVLIGGLASIVPTFLGGILPFQGIMLGAVLIVGALFLAGKVPAPLPQALGVAGGGIVAGTLLAGGLGDLTGSMTTDGGSW